MKLVSQPKRASAASVWLLLILSGCGGGTGDARLSEQAASPSTTASASSSKTASISSEALLAEGAKLNQATLRDAESASQAAAPISSLTDLDQLTAGQVIPKNAYASGAVVRKAAASLVPVWRFFNRSTGAHFITRSATERDSVMVNLAPPKGSFVYEGEAYKVASINSPGLAPVHRFYNTQTGVHFYTISESERANIVATLPQFSYEGSAYYASQVNGTGMTPLYRFFIPSKGFHFYTASLQERDNIRANQAAYYQYEGVGYYVLASNWEPQPEPPAVIPHSGMTSAQCVKASTFGDYELCNDPEVLALNTQQDGHRAHINPMSYSTVGAYPITSCLKDNVTGLIWEGKTEDGGPRHRGATYSNHSSSFGRPTDASGYITYVNSIGLCGYTDWRLPTQFELLSIADYGKWFPAINTTWFVGGTYSYWTSEKFGWNSAYTATVSYLGNGSTSGSSHAASQESIRLVRGYGHTTQRYSYTTASFGADAANNVVVDNWTGLKWRRCEEGRTWNGSGCSGAAIGLTRVEALAWARDMVGWRLPNVKELASLVDLSATSGATIDATAFPGAVPNRFWSSTPMSGYAKSRFTDFSDGAVNDIYGSIPYRVRLVQLTP